MRGACIVIAILGACGSDPVQDGVYTGTISSSGCIAGKPLSIEVIDGTVLMSSTARCSTNSVTDGDVDYSCSFGGGETHYRCMSQGPVVDRSETVHATAEGTKLVGTIMRDEKTLAPPNCTVQSTCVDSGTFELVRQ